jgi:glycosyltransferase involved in cell wall biosynthesis
LIFQTRLGKGGAIKEGFKAAIGDIVGFADADESVTSRDFKGMFNAIKGLDGVIASRRLPESRIL